jgi:hypothetical protein
MPAGFIWLRIGTSDVLGEHDKHRIHNQVSDYLLLEKLLVELFEMVITRT